MSPIEVLGMAAHEDRWAVFWRFGAPELPQSQVVLSLPDQEHPSRQLKHALSLDTVLWRGGSIRVVASFEFARPSLFRVATNGRLRWLPSMVPPQGGLPPPNHHHFNGRLAAHDGQVVLEVTSAAGDPLTRLGPFGGPETLQHRLVAVSRAEGGFVVGYFERESGAWALRVDRIQCPAGEPALEDSGAAP